MLSVDCKWTWCLESKCKEFSIVLNPELNAEVIIKYL